MGSFQLQYDAKNSANMSFCTCCIGPTLLKQARTSIRLSDVGDQARCRPFESKENKYIELEVVFPEVRFPFHASKFADTLTQSM